MGRQAAVRAYRDSIYDAAELGAEVRSGSRSFPIIGGIVPALGVLFNGLWRPFKILGALVFGYSDAPRDFPAMPEVPKAFAGTDLGKAFEDSWKLKQQATQARVSGFADLLNLDITDWWQKASVARFAEAKDQNVIFSEEGAARARANGAGVGFAAGILSGRSDSGRER